MSKEPISCGKGPARDPRSRFTGRVRDYALHRPSYPRRVVELLESTGFISSTDVVADVGSGTGKLSEVFLERGNPVIGVEPDREMRGAAERLLGDRVAFRSVDGSAEATGLADGSVDVVAAGQAFHWFDAASAREEFRRILRGDQRVVLVWNFRRTDASAFMSGYEELLRRHGTDYGTVRHRRLEPAALAAFYGSESYHVDVVPNRQELDLEGLRGRVESASYVPSRDQPGHAAMLAALRGLFERHGAGGRVTFEYETVVYSDRLLAVRGG